MPKYQWEAKPPLTRNDIFNEGWEVGVLNFTDDADAISWLERKFKQHDIGQSLIIRVLQGNRLVRQMKTTQIGERKC